MGNMCCRREVYNPSGAEAEFDRCGQNQQHHSKQQQQQVSKMYHHNPHHHAPVGDDCAINELLEGWMDLSVTLPDGRKVRLTVERRTPMMDLLVQAASTTKINPASHMINVYVDGDRKNSTLPYKPSTPIGSLDTNTIYIVSKKDATLETQGRRLLRGVQRPFEPTFRVQVHLPRNQLTVLRLSPRVRISELRSMVCKEKGFDPDKYELVRPRDHAQTIDGELTLADYGSTEITLLSKASIESYMSTTTSHIMGYPKRTEETKPGILRLLAEDNCRNVTNNKSYSKQRFCNTDDGQQNKARPKKRRPAPPPPPPVLIEPPSHSRQSSSDSSGYHETTSSLLHYDNSLEEKDSSDSSGVSSLDCKDSSPATIIQTQKKKKAPAPPPPQRKRDVRHISQIEQENNAQNKAMSAKESRKSAAPARPVEADPKETTNSAVVDPAALRGPVIQEERAIPGDLVQEDYVAHSDTIDTDDPQAENSFINGATNKPLISENRTLPYREKDGLEATDSWTGSDHPIHEKVSAKSSLDSSKFTEEIVTTRAALVALNARIEQDVTQQEIESSIQAAFHSLDCVDTGEDSPDECSEANPISRLSATPDSNEELPASYSVVFKEIPAKPKEPPPLPSSLKRSSSLLSFRDPSPKPAPPRPAKGARPLQRSLSDLSAEDKEDFETEQKRLQQEYVKLQRQFILWQQQLMSNHTMLREECIVPPYPRTLRQSHSLPEGEDFPEDSSPPIPLVSRSLSYEPTKERCSTFPRSTINIPSLEFMPISVSNGASTLRSSKTKSYFKPPLVRASTKSRQRLPPEIKKEGDVDISDDLKMLSTILPSFESLKLIAENNDEDVPSRLRDAPPTEMVRERTPLLPLALSKHNSKMDNGGCIISRESKDTGQLKGSGDYKVTLQSHPPPPPPIPNGNSTLRRVLKENKVNQQETRNGRKNSVPEVDPRDQLMQEIRKFGGRTALRKISLAN